MMVIKFAYVGDQTRLRRRVHRRRRRVGVGEFASRRVDRIPNTVQLRNKRKNLAIK